MSNKIIEIGFKKKVQPVRIDGIDFEIDMSEKMRKKQEISLLEMQKEMEKLETEAQNLRKNGGDEEKEREIINKTIENVREITDLMLGEGAYLKLYEAADEDHEVVFDAIIDLASSLKSISEKRKAQSFINGKKKRK